MAIPAARSGVIGQRPVDLMDAAFGGWSSRSGDHSADVWREKHDASPLQMWKTNAEEHLAGFRVALFDEGFRIWSSMLPEGIGLRPRSPGSTKLDQQVIVP